jgi:DNA-binding response OmpR family regulator
VKPDIVVLDLSIPIVDGFEFLRRRGAECSARVLAGSGGFGRELVAGLPVAAFVAKPFDLHVLIGVIARSLGADSEERTTQPLN